MHIPQQARRCAFMLAIALLVAASVAAVAVPDVGASHRQNNKIWPPGSHFLGKSYGDWAASWWKWIIREGAVPLYDSTGEDCAVGQSGRVWFLAGSQVGPVERSCEIPADKAIFFPIQNIVWLSFPDDPYIGYPDYPPPGGEDVVRAGLAAANDDSGGRSATIDGDAVEYLDDYRFTSPTFGEQWPGWLYLDPCYDDGWYLLLKPLPVGEHTVTFTGWDGGQDVTYHLTIVDDD